MGTPKQVPQFEVPIHVLSASVDPGLNNARAMLLRHHGLQVITAESPAYARERIESHSFHVLIFGSTLDRDTCWQLADVFRKRNPAGKIIEILPSPWSAPKNRPDAIVVSSDEPTALVATIAETLLP